LNEAIPEVGKLIKVNSYPDPYWLLPIQGKVVKLDTKQLYQQQLDYLTTISFGDH
jgi:hypothetical protein